MAVVLTLAAAKLPTLPDEAGGILLCLVPFIKNKTDTELEMVCREVNISSRREISQSQYDRPDTQLSQGIKLSEETHVNSTVSPVIENSETKTLNDICDMSVITTHTINQDGDVANDAANSIANRTVSPVVENNDIKIFNDTCNKPDIKADTINQGTNIVNEARLQLYSNTTSGQYLDFSRKSTHPNSRSDNTKRSEKSTSKAQKPQ